MNQRSIQGCLFRKQVSDKLPHNFRIPAELGKINIHYSIEEIDANWYIFCQLNKHPHPHPLRFSQSYTHTHTSTTYTSSIVLLYTFVFYFFTFCINVQYILISTLTTTVVEWLIHRLSWFRYLWRPGFASQLGQCRNLSILSWVWAFVIPVVFLITETLLLCLFSIGLILLFSEVGAFSGTK